VAIITPLLCWAIMSMGKAIGAAEEEKRQAQREKNATDAMADTLANPATADDAVNSMRQGDF
jgi:hypothetical protein